MKKFLLTIFLSLSFIFINACNTSKYSSESIAENLVYYDIPSLYTDIFEPFSQYVSEKSFDFVKEELKNFNYAAEIYDTSIKLSDDLGHSVAIVSKDNIICLVQYATAEKSIAVSDSLGSLEAPIFITSNGSAKNLEQLKDFMFSDN